jgi:hypothetical protein
MKRDPIDEGRINEHSHGLGTVTLVMVRARAHELAIINGRPRGAVLDSDFDEALRELTGEPEISPKEAILEAAPESERWDPVPGSFGHRAPVVPTPDEQLENEKLVDEGVDEAEHDQMLLGSWESARRDRGA